MRIGLVAALTLLMGCSTLAAPSPVPLPTPATASPRALVIDTDMAVDDWMAILYLLQRPEVTISAITVTGAGESHCAPGIQHVLGLATLSGYGPLRVACGRETPLQGHHAFPTRWREEVDRLLGLTLPEGQNLASPLTAVELLASVIQTSPNKVTLLTLGPLTNLAETLQTHPAVRDHIERLYIMGGAVKVPGNVSTTGVGIHHPVAEWNVYVDPYAAKVVLHAGVPITLVPLDATNQVPVTAQFYTRLQRNHRSPEAAFVFDMLSKQKAFIDSGDYYFWDPLAAAILTDDSLATFQNQNLCVVETEEPDSGRTQVGLGCPAVQVAVSADRERFEQLFLETLNTVSWPLGGTVLPP